MSKLILVIVCICLTTSFSLVYAQSKSKALDANATLKETLDWLKARVPYTHLQPQSDARAELRQEGISHLQANGCTLKYEITRQTMSTGRPGSVDFEEVQQGTERQQWRVDLSGLNPQMIRFEPAKQQDRPPRIFFTSFDFRNPDVVPQVQSNGVAVVTNYRGKAIWHSDRMGIHAVREEFIGWGAFPVRDEAKGEMIVAALKHAVELCRERNPAKSKP